MSPLFFTEQETYAFLTNSASSSAHRVQSPELKRQRQTQNHEVGKTASPPFPSMHLDDSPGSAHGGAPVAMRSYQATTPDGVNAQSSLPNNVDTHHYIRKEDRIVTKNATLNSGVLGRDVADIANVVRSVVQEELREFKKDMRCVIRDEVDDVADQLHRDIMNLQVEMLKQFQIHQVTAQFCYSITEGRGILFWHCLSVCTPRYINDHGVDC